MAKKEFNLGNQLAEALGKVSEPDTDGMEQIVAIDINNIDGDADNFYSMNGLDELAANIELIGLQQPLRVRANPDMPGRYLIVSGHRRRAALWTLYEEQPEKWRRVPCIIEQPAASPELQELRLIYANANTRTMSSADLAAQAERVEMLLYKLKGQGVEFPGRMRDHVAEACRISSTKLATLKAIKNNLIPELLEHYQCGEINESAAYELQKLPKEAQEAIAKSAKTGASFIRGVDVEYCVENAEKLMAADACPDGTACDHQPRRFVQVLRSQYSWARCEGKCCLKCHDLDRCGQPCAKGRAKKEKAKLEEKAERAKRDADAEKSRERANREHKLMRQQQAQRILPLIEKAGLGDKCELPGDYSYSKTKVSEIRKAAAGDFGDGYYYTGNMLPTSVDGLKEIADRLGCSLDYLAGRTDDPTPSEPAQRLISVDESYPAEGQYVIAYTRGLAAIPSVYFRAAFMDCTEKSVANNRLTGIEYWSPRPKLPAGKKWPGQEIIEGMVRK